MKEELRQAENRKTILVTGGSTGIGAATVRRFAGAGWNVALCDVNDAVGRELVDELGDSCLYLHADTRRADEVEAAIADAAEHFGRINAVFANAGIHRRNNLLDVSEEEFDLIVKTNIYGTFHTLKAAAPYLIKQGGAIVINASDQSTIGKRGNFVYGLTKGALGQMTKSLSAELGPYGVRVNAVCPGTIRTPLVDTLFESVSRRSGVSVDELWAEENALFARGSVGTPEEVAEMVFFLVSDAAAFCTGGLYPIDGGLTAVR